MFKERLKINPCKLEQSEVDASKQYTCQYDYGRHHHQITIVPEESYFSFIIVQFSANECESEETPQEQGQVEASQSDGVAFGRVGNKIDVDGCNDYANYGKQHLFSG